jgi:phosphoribosylformylglycinamidine synthase
VLGDDLIKILFSENPGVVIQTSDEKAASAILKANQIRYEVLGEVTNNRSLILKQKPRRNTDIDVLRDTWFKTSFLLDSKQRPKQHALKAVIKITKNRSSNISSSHLLTDVLKRMASIRKEQKPSGLNAAIIREKGVNGDREMAFSLYLAGFDVKDIHMTDLISGREDLSDVNLIVFVGGFSNSDVLGAAKGWAGAFLYNPKAKESLAKFYQRNNTLSLGVCNGCQLMMELGLVYPDWKEHPKMHHNSSGKFESIFVNLEIPENNSV